MIMDVAMWCLIFMVVVTPAVPRGRCACVKQASKNLVNECANPALNNCDEDATCTDLPDGFSCTCNAGFTGDGTTCTELCNGVVCDAGENRTCYRDESCVCIPGFHVLGDACVEGEMFTDYQCYIAKYQSCSIVLYRCSKKSYTENVF